MGAAALTVALPLALRQHPSEFHPGERQNATTAAVSQVPVAPLLLVRVTDASGSMKVTDPGGRRFGACEAMLAAVAAARPAPAKTIVAPIFFGSRTVAFKPYRLSAVRPARPASFGRDLGNTNFAQAIDAATAVVRAFLSSPENAAGRAVVFILTDGVPDLGNGRPVAALWPGIGRSVARLRRTGAEIDLLGISNSSSSWGAAALHWRALLGAAQVHLVDSSSSLYRLYRSFAQTSLEIGKLQGTQLKAGRSLELRAGDYSSAFTIQATALQSGAGISIQSGSSTTVLVSAALASRGEQRTWRIPTRPHDCLVVHNLGHTPVQVTTRTETAVLQPSGQLSPCIGAPVDGFLASLCNGLNEPISPLGSDPLALSALLTTPQTLHGPAAASPMQVRAYAPGRYTLSAPGRWQSGAYRLTVLSRSASGEVGRADYRLVPQLQPWASLAKPLRLTSLADASTVHLDVTLFLDKRAVRPEQVSASGSASVLAQLCDLGGGRVRASVWMTEAGDGSLTASMPAVVHDGLLRLSVIDRQGRIVSTRLLLWRMRATIAQAVLAGLLFVAVAMAISIALLGLGLCLWIALKPALPGALVVTGGERPLRLELLGRKFKLATLSDTVGSSRWLILPASRSSLRVVRLGFPLRTTLIHRGRETAIDERSARLV